MLSEADNTHAQFWDDPYNNVATENWVGEMANYLKNELKSKQLITVSHTGIVMPFNEELGYHPVDIWANPDIDLISGHKYYTRLDGLDINADGILNSLNEYEKPCIYNELAVADWGNIDRCTIRAMHEDLWSSAFSGAYGSGVQWDWQRYPFRNPDWYNAVSEHLEDEYRNLRDFFAYIDLNISNGYAPHHSTLGLYPTYGFTPFANYYLVKDGGNSNKAYGWFCNRSINEFTHGNCDYVDPSTNFNTMSQIMAANSSTSYGYYGFNLLENYSDYFPTPLIDYPLPTSSFSLAGLIPNAQYKIEYFYTSGNGNFEPAFDSVFTTGPVGTIFITNGPPTGLIGSVNYPGDWAYLVHLENEPRILATQHQPVIVNNPLFSNKASNQNNNQSIQIGLAPNPNDGSFIITVNSLTETRSTWYLTDVSGNVIYTSTIILNEGVNQINYTNKELAAGVYFVRVDSYNEVFKVIIVK